MQISKSVTLSRSTRIQYLRCKLLSLKSIHYVVSSNITDFTGVQTKLCLTLHAAPLTSKPRICDYLLLCRLLHCRSPAASCELLNGLIGHLTHILTCSRPRNYVSGINGFPICRDDELIAIVTSPNIRERCACSLRTLIFLLGLCLRLCSGACALRGIMGCFIDQQRAQSLL